LNPPRGSHSCETSRNAESRRPPTSTNATRSLRTLVVIGDLEEIFRMLLSRERLCGRARLPSPRRRIHPWVVVGQPGMDASAPEGMRRRTSWQWIASTMTASLMCGSRRCSNLPIVLAIVVSGPAPSWCRICDRAGQAHRVLRTAAVRGRSMSYVDQIVVLEVRVS